MLLRIKDIAKKRVIHAKRSNKIMIRCILLLILIKNNLSIELNCIEIVFAKNANLKITFDDLF